MNRFEKARAVLAGALAFATLTALGLAAVAVLDAAPGNQSLLANGQFHIAAGALACSLALAVTGWRVVGGVAAVLAAGLTFSAIDSVNWRSASAAGATGGKVDFVLFNVYAQNRRSAAIVEWLERERPDVAVLLEAEPLAGSLERLRRTFPYQVGCAGERCEALLLSRHPLTEAAARDLPVAPERFVAARLEVNGSPLWVFGAHWGKFFFTSMRRDQANATLREVRRRIRRDGAPFVLAGDFNATQWDPSLKRLTRRLEVAHPAVWMPTWPIRLGPFGGQIDHILTPQAITVEDLDYLPRELGSNHRGLRARLTLPEGGEPRENTH